MYKDIWILILNHLNNDLKSLSSFARVSKYFNTLVNDNSLWRYFCNKLNKDEILEYKKENTWKEIYRMLSVIKTIKFENYIKIILKGNNRCYYLNREENIEKQLKIYDLKQENKLLNIINIYKYRFWWHFIILSDNNKLFEINILNLNDIKINEYSFSLEKNDIIKNVLSTNYTFIIIKNLNIYKIFLRNYKEQLKLVFELNYTINNIIFNNKNYEFEYLDDNNKLQSIILNEFEVWNIYRN